MEIGLSFGTNQADRIEHLRSAKKRVLAEADVALITASPIYETEPVDVQPEFADQPFLNSVMIVETQLAPEQFADRLHEIESHMGRVRSSDQNAPRPIDIDVIYVDNITMQSDTLTLPHARWSQRRFVVQPLADVRPDLVLPGSTQAVKDILQDLPERPTAQRIATLW